MESPEFQSIGSADALPIGSRRLVQVGTQPVLVINRGGVYLAFDDYCPHRAGPLSEGTFTDTAVTCPWHGAQFDLRTGAALCGPSRGTLHLRQVRVVHGQVEVSTTPRSQPDKSV